MPHSDFEDERIQEFITAAREYCQLLTFFEDSVKVFVEKVSQQLAILYSAAIRLPEINEDFPEIDEEAFQLVSTVPPLPNEVYWFQFSSQSSEILVSSQESIRLDLFEIFEDVRPGLEQIDATEALLARAYAQRCKISFEIHWGFHLVKVLVALHALTVSLRESELGL